MAVNPFSIDVVPNWQGLLACLRREGTPDRVYFAELLIDDEVKAEVARRFELAHDVRPEDPCYGLVREVRVQRFLGYDYVKCGLDEVGLPLDWRPAADTATLRREGGRQYLNERRGPIATREEFERYPWPDPKALGDSRLRWYQENLPEDMCIVAHSGFGHPLEFLAGLMGYETLCYALFDQRDLVAAIGRRLDELYAAILRRILRYDRVKVIWASDDMGFRSGTMIGPDDLRQFVLPIHQRLAEISHAAGRPYLLHSCGKLDAVMDDLLDAVKIDGFHSFEDTIHSVEETKEKYGRRIAVLGGIDLDFLCRSTPEAVRRRTRRTLEACHPGGGYCLGTGNSVANYVPLENYLAMLDEGRKFGRA
jgi:uroporphyrinogen decarboxylase